MICLALALAMVSAWLLVAPAGVPTAQAQVNVNINIGKVASPVVKAGGSSNGAAFAMCVPAAARGEYSSIPGEGAVTFTGLRSAAEMVGLFPFGEGEWDCCRLRR